LIQPELFDEESYLETVHQQAAMLERTFREFNTQVTVVDVQTGPVISQFELKLSKGTRLKKVQQLADDIAISLKVQSARVVAPIPGKNTVGVELPNEYRQIVRIREVMESRADAKEKYHIPVYLGKDVSGQPMIIDLTKLPHLLIAGRTGTGKSVCLNSIIVSMLMTRSPEQVRMLMIDPKMVELSPYKTIPHLMHPVVTDMRKAEAILGWAVEKMEERYQLLASVGVRQLSEYNKLSEDERRRRMGMIDVSEEEWAEVPQFMPYIVIIADEISDLMLTAGKNVETHIIRLAQKSRAVGIHLVLATQKPTVDVVTGLIKSNLPARIAFGVATRTDSLVVLDRIGAERLLGSGDMLFLHPETGQIIRGQGTYVSDKEIESIIEIIGTDEPDFVEELVAINPDEESEKPADNEGEIILRDDLYNQAVEYVIQQGRGSLSLIQRRFRVGYSRAARMIDFMAEDGVVGAYNGSKAREVIMTLGDWKRRRAAGTSRMSVYSSSPKKYAEPKNDDFEDEFESEYDDEYEEISFKKR
jgi:S-DNA-T family DNA segregation ATPase FtsK/SpoIIIE